MTELKAQIQSALNQFANGALLQNAKVLLNTLGYESDRTLALSPNNYKGFSEQFNVAESNFNPEKAKTTEWESIDIIFQITEDDIKKTQSLFQTKQVDNKIIESYLFFAISLKGDRYTRSDLVKITREINKLTPMPSMILFRYNDYLTIAVIDRRLHKREASKDVLEKVTLIKDINIQKPHRAHIEILYDLALENLISKYGISNFIALHSAWRKTLDTSELNKKFYRELANWYFWALDNVEFPKDGGLDGKVRNAEAVIRLLTRLIFIWFIKEKRLVPDDLFTEARVRSLLKNLEPDNSTYYKAILQNLFFATLNTDQKETPRRWRGKNKGNGQDSHYLIPNVYRYKDEFNTPDEAFTLFQDIPFLNGGLFECLDKEVKDEDLKNMPELANLVVEEGRGRILRIDGFSERKENPLYFPNKLFFLNERTEDLNDIYGTKNKAYKVRGLINILERYKFTVDENTPVEEEIALDPELLGKVFESLLASYNPETQTTARKQTGSFYTPREIVNYMVDESLIAYLSSKLPSPPAGEGEGKGDGRHSREGGNPEAEQKIRHLISYTDEPHKFIPAEVDALINAIDNVKILDPACGSGAFPMGMLHKLVYILGKVDPDNSKWRDIQKQKAIMGTEEAYKIGDKEEREKRLLDISEVFENNASDYGRKLYLIENCIFGVDIQPIAVQIAKLRFFISLIVDQRINPNKENLGVRPLPNLETKFVAANTLIGIERPAQGMLRNPEIDKKEAKLKRVREKHFTARTLKTKRECREKDDRLRAEISELLKQDGFPSDVTKKLVRWNPYDQNTSAVFFDSEWMFGIKTPSQFAGEVSPKNPSPLVGEGKSEGGFDVVIGNPPYVSVKAISSDDKFVLSKEFDTGQGRFNLFTLFLEKGHKLLSVNGILTFIIPEGIYSHVEYRHTRNYLLNNATIILINLFSNKVFEAAVDTTILSIKNSKNSQRRFCVYKDLQDKVFELNQKLFQDYPFNLFAVNMTSQTFNIINRFINNKSFDILENILEIQQGIIYSGQPKNKVFANFPKDRTFKKVLDGRDILRWRINWDDKIDNKYISYTDKLHRPREERLFIAKEKILLPRKSTKIACAYDDKQFYALNTAYICLLKNNDYNLKYILSLLNSKFINFFYSSLFFGWQITIPALSTLPIKKIDEKDQHPFITLVDQILAAKKHAREGINQGKDPNADTSALEGEIDKMVYELYELTPEEIAIVEGKCK